MSHERPAVTPQDEARAAEIFAAKGIDTPEAAYAALRQAMSERRKGEGWR